MIRVIKSMRHILVHLGKYRKYIRLGYPVAILESNMAFVPYMLLFYLIKVGIERPFERKDFYTVFLGMVVSVALRAVFKRLHDILQQDKGYYAFAENRLKLTEHLAKLNMGYYTDGNIGNITSVITTDISFIEEYAMMQMGILISGMASLVPSTIFLFLFDLRLGALYLGLILIGTLCLGCFLRAMNRNARTRQDNLSRLSHAVLNFMRGMQTIKAFNMQREKSTEMNTEIERTQKGSLHFVTDVAGAQLLFLLGSSLPTAAMIIYISHLILARGFDLAYGLGFIVFSFVIFLPLTLFGNAAEILEIAEASIERYNVIMQEKEMEDRKNASIPIEKMDIQFRDVSFAYEEKQVLKEINLEIKDRSFTALVGRSGSGKTTIANLIARFWDVEEGEIRIDGKNIKEIPTQTLLSNISMVFQRVYLFNDTIYNNIAFGNPKATREEVIEAAKKARCHDFILKLEQGYDTMVGEGGSTLSGGEKQRISIARAILKDAPLILLDESTAGIDPENERFIQEAIEELVRDKTLIVIAHRLSTIRHADRIVYMEDGRILESGTHEELLARKGEYKKQYDFYSRKQV